MNLDNLQSFILLNYEYSVGELKINLCINVSFAVSNEVPEVPVISPVSGTVYERRLIEKFINENGNKDPVNGEPLEIDQLIEVKTPAFVKAKPPTHTSIPGILKSLQDEWDAVMLYRFVKEFF